MSVPHLEALQCKSGGALVHELDVHGADHVVRNVVTHVQILDLPVLRHLLEYVLVEVLQAISDAKRSDSSDTAACATVQTRCQAEELLHICNNCKHPTSKCSWLARGSIWGGRPSAPGAMLIIGFWYMFCSSSVWLMVGLLWMREQRSPCRHALRWEARNSTPSAVLHKMAGASGVARSSWRRRALQRREVGPCTCSVELTQPHQGVDRQHEAQPGTTATMSGAEIWHAARHVALSSMLEVRTRWLCFCTTADVQTEHSPDFEIKGAVDAILFCSEDGGKMLSHGGPLLRSKMTLYY